MAKLILKFNNEVIDHIELTQGDMRIGRKPTNEIFVDNLAVSGEHANIFTIGEDSFVQDLGSTNGTFVNNKRITKHHLKNGDVIAIGKHSMVFFTEDTGAEEHTEDFAKTVILGSPAAPAAAAPEAPKANYADETMAMKGDPKADTAQRQGAIFVLSGANSGKRIELTKSVTNLGKTGRVSGAIMRQPQGYSLASHSGGDDVKLNGRVLGGGTEETLKNGDVIEVAGTRLQFYLK